MRTKRCVDLTIALMTHATRTSNLATYFDQLYRETPAAFAVSTSISALAAEGDEPGFSPDDSPVN